MCITREVFFKNVYLQVPEKMVTNHLAVMIEEAYMTKFDACTKVAIVSSEIQIVLPKMF